MRGLPLLLLALFLGAAPSPEERGRRIYLEGVSPSGGEIVAVMGEGVEVPASAMHCSGCHGRDGRGRPEGGVTPSDLTWDSLTRPYGVTHPSGRKHPPYDDRSLKKAIAMGLDPAGNPLHVAMPRFRMGQQDMADLLAYLRLLGRETEPGVGADAVRIGAILPPSGLAGMGKAVRDALAARFEDAGSLWGRRIEVRAPPWSPGRLHPQGGSEPPRLAPGRRLDQGGVIRPATHPAEPGHGRRVRR